MGDLKVTWSHAFNVYVRFQELLRILGLTVAGLAQLLTCVLLSLRCLVFAVYRSFLDGRPWLLLNQLKLQQRDPLRQVVRQRGQ